MPPASAPDKPWAYLRAGVSETNDALELHRLHAELLEAVRDATNGLRTGPIDSVEYPPTETADALALLEQLGYSTDLLRVAIADRPTGWLIVALAATREPVPQAEPNPTKGTP